MLDETTLPAPTPCPECGGERVHADAGAYMSVTVPSDSAFFGRSTSTVRAVVCTAGGYTTLYAKKPEKLRNQ